MALIDRFFRRAIRRGKLTVQYPGGRTAEYGIADPNFPDVSLRIADNRVFAQILADPALGSAEAYMDGRLSVETGDLLDLVTLFAANNRWEDGRATLKAGLPRRMVDAVAHRLGRINMARRSKRNVAHHYDLSDRLYDLFLDRDRQYSCAYFNDPADTLEQAQLAKKAHIAAKLAIEPGMRVLDIGCGWGGTALYLHRTTGADVTGITLSEEQLKVARARADTAGVADRVRFELIDYRHVTGTFDRIVSIGMFEHVGPKHFRAFFEKCESLLSPDGVMLVHTIGRMGGPGVTDPFTQRYIFPGGYIPALSELVAANHATRMIVTDVEVLRLHYAWTLKHWYDRTVAARDAIVELYDERFYRMWQYYLAGCLVSFAHGGLVNYQVQFARDRHALPVTRDYMAAREAALLARG